MKIFPTSFPAELEAAYQEDLNDQKKRAAREMAFLAALLFACFAILDRWAIPGALGAVLILRFGVVIPVLLLIAYIANRPFLLRNYRASMTLMYLVTGLSIEAMVWVAGPDDLARLVYYSGLILVVTGLFTCTFLGVLEAGFIGFSLALLYIVIALLGPGIRNEAEWVTFYSNCFFLLSANVLGLFSVRIRERNLRHLFLVKRSLQAEMAAKEKAEMEARNTLRQQEELVQLRLRFVTMSSHEFRNPLSVILSSQELLAKYSDRLPEAEKGELLQRIGVACQRMTRLMNSIQSVSIAEAQLLAFKPERLDLPALCRSLADEALLLHPESPCRIRTSFAPGLPANLYDEKSLRYILRHLLSNAVKYSPAGGEIDFRVGWENGETVIEVADCGIGIPEADLPDVFKSFQRASNVGAIEGADLGLSIVRNAVALHGGTVAIRSVVGQGTTVTVRLPENPPSELSSLIDDSPES